MKKFYKKIISMMIACFIVLAIMVSFEKINNYNKKHDLVYGYTIVEVNNNVNLSMQNNKTQSLLAQTANNEEFDYSIILVIIIIVVVAAIVFKIIEKNRRNKLTCKNCKQIYNEDDIEYREIRKFTKHSPDNYSNVSKSIYSVVEFIFTCHNCGKVKKFTKNFKIYYYHDPGTSTSRPTEKYFDLQKLIDDFLNLNFKEKQEAKQLKKLDKELNKEAKQVEKALNSKKYQEILQKQEENNNKYTDQILGKKGDIVTDYKIFQQNHETNTDDNDES